MNKKWFVNTKQQRHCISSLTILLLSVFIPHSFAKGKANNTTDQCTKEVISVHCGKTPSLAFDSNNNIWAVFEQNGFIYLTYSKNIKANQKREKFNPPIAVNSKAEKIYTNGENRPKIAMGKKGEIYITWTQKTDGFYTGNIRFTRSLDQGKTFSPITTINDDGLLTSHRFESLRVSDNGTIFISWLDKRDQEKAKKNGNQYTGAALYYSYSTDQGKSFHSNQKIADNTCVCCRLAMTPTRQNNMAVFWRHIYEGNIRDHTLAVIGETGVILQPNRATFDEWKINACPHQGPSLDQADGGLFDLTWFTASEQRKGLYYAKYNPLNQSVKKLLNLSKSGSAAHPFILNIGNKLHIVWKEFDGKNTHIYHKESKTKGANWTSTISIAKTRGKSDHPYILQQDKQAWLSWHTANEGLNLLPIN
ncbi:sialidase family protein [Aliikangiella sp. IMCC44359]|uniref:sialidase family protein n=1 Tax=Aliikangiella sp. IMCC44359 TaxID=3459125 RepID=UPI00403A9015